MEEKSWSAERKRKNVSKFNVLNDFIIFFSSSSSLDAGAFGWLCSAYLVLKYKNNKQMYVRRGEMRKWLVLWEGATGKKYLRCL